MEDLTDIVELLVSELVTNAVKVTGIMQPVPTWSELSGVTLVHLRLVLTDDALIIEVADGDCTPPEPQDNVGDAEGGRGLLIVEQLTKRWSYYYPRHGGKVVWCEVPLRPET